MLEQWQQFLDENSSNWSYGVVPNLVKELDKAIRLENPRLFNAITYQLAKHGITLDKKGHLRFATELIREELERERSERVARAERSEGEGWGSGGE